MADIPTLLDGPHTIGARLGIPGDWLVTQAGMGHVPAVVTGKRAIMTEAAVAAAVKRMAAAEPDSMEQFDFAVGLRVVAACRENQVHDAGCVRIVEALAHSAECLRENGKLGLWDCPAKTWAVLLQDDRAVIVVAPECKDASDVLRRVPDAHVVIDVSHHVQAAKASILAPLMTLPADDPQEGKP